MGVLINWQFLLAKDNLSYVDHINFMKKGAEICKYETEES